MKWYLKVMKNFATFTGRAQRAEYWMFSLVNFFIYIALVVLMGLTAAGIESEGGGEVSVLGMVMIGVYFLYVIAIILPTLSVTVRRLHDTGKSGWWFLISFIPLIGGLWLLILMVLDSESGTNQYGTNPKMGLDDVADAFE